jgi:hypothetical protein
MTERKKRAVYRKARRLYGKVSCSIVSKREMWDISWTECPVCGEKPDALGNVNHRQIVIKKWSGGQSYG